MWEATRIQPGCSGRVAHHRQQAALFHAWSPQHQSRIVVRRKASGIARQQVRPLEHLVSERHHGDAARLERLGRPGVPRTILSTVATAAASSNGSPMNRRFHVRIGSSLRAAAWTTSSRGPSFGSNG